MRITAIEPFVCDGGLREFGFLKVTTDEGIVGWAETYDWHTSASLMTALQVMGRRLIGEDPRRIELMNEKIWYGGRPGVPERQKVLAAMEETLGLAPDALALTWRSLREVGNLSSTSVLLVLRDTMEGARPPEGSYGMMLAMGPGFCSELVLLQW